MLKVKNIDRFPAMGGMPSEHDRGVVLDMNRREAHPITGESQPVKVYGGTLAECWAYVRQHEAEATH